MDAQKIRLVFMGTPEFAATILARLLAWEGGEVVGVYSQPDRPCGRGMVCRPTPVKETAMKAGIDEIRQPENFRNPDDVRALAELAPDVLVVAAYGLILPQSVLDVPRLGPVNVHASLLPKYRGAAPIQRCLMNGDKVTGISIMRMVRELDAGPILLQRALAIGIDDDARTLHDELAKMGGEVLIEALERLSQGRIHPVPQNDAIATFAPKLKKEEGLIDWNQPAERIHNLIRGLQPWPGAHFEHTSPTDGKSITLKVFPGRIGAEKEEKKTSGTITGLEGDCLAIACQDRYYLINTLQPAHKKVMKAREFFCGYMNRC